MNSVQTNCFSQLSHCKLKEQKKIFPEKFSKCFVNTVNRDGQNN